MVFPKLVATSASRSLVHDPAAYLWFGNRLDGTLAASRSYLHGPDFSYPEAEPEALPQAKVKDCQFVLHLASGGPTQKGELQQMPHSRTNAVILSNSTEPYHCHGMPCQYPPIWKC